MLELLWLSQATWFAAEPEDKEPWHCNVVTNGNDGTKIFFPLRGSEYVHLDPVFRRTLRSRKGKGNLLFGWVCAVASHGHSMQFSWPGHSLDLHNRRAPECRGSSHAMSNASSAHILLLLCSHNPDRCISVVSAHYELYAHALDDPWDA